MLPRAIVRIASEAFGDSQSCLGSQLVELLQSIGVLYPNLLWYGADVQTIGPSPTSRRQPTPVLIGNTESLVRAATQVEQFESGVFAGVAQSLEHPVFREGGMWTEDEDSADIGDAVIEIRAFDTSYWLIATVDTNLSESVMKRFGASS